MKEIKVSIHQPEFLPYRGLFYKISQADIHIFLDDVQAERNAGSKNGWQYRNKFPEGYINAPKSKIHLGQTLNEVSMPNMNMSLADWNIPMIVTTCQLFKYKAKFFRSSQLGVHETDPNIRLVKLVQAVGGNAYIAGSGGHNYMNFKPFKEAGIKLYFMDFHEDDYLSTTYHLINDGLINTKQYIKGHGKLEVVDYDKLDI